MKTHRTRLHWVLWGFVCVALVGMAQPVAAHKIHLTDGTTITADQVWREDVGFVLTEQALADLQAEGLPDEVFNSLMTLKNQEYQNEKQFLSVIQIRIGTEQLDTYKDLILKHVGETSIVKYQRFGGTMSIPSERVLKIEYEEEKPSTVSGGITLDLASKQVIEDEKGALMERYNILKNRRKRASPDEVPEIQQEQSEILERVDDLKEDPIGYFMEFKPGWVCLTDDVVFGKRVILNHPKFAECKQSCGKLPVLASPSKQNRFRVCVYRCVGIKE